MKTSRPVFLCGMPRSASTWLGRTLAAHPDIGVFGESDYWGRDYVEPSASGVYDERRIGRVVALQAAKDWSTTTGDEGGQLAGLAHGRYGELAAAAAVRASPPTTPQALYQAICDAVASEQGVEVVVDKTPGHLLFMDRYAPHFPDSPFVVVGREPLGFVASLTHRREGKGLLDAPVLRRLAYHPALTVVMWRRYARALRALDRHGSDRILRLDHADIARSPADTLRRICAHLGVDPDRVAVDDRPVNSSFRGDRRAGPPAATGYWLALLARREWEALYPGGRAPRTTPLKTVLSWLLLAPGLLAFLLYAPRPVRWFGYLANFIGLGRSGSERGGGS